LPGLLRITIVRAAETAPNGPTHWFGPLPPLQKLLPAVASVSRNKVDLLKRENWRTAYSLVNPSRRFYKSLTRFGMKLINTSIGCLKSKNPL
jgi:hypothetical protein